MADVLADGRSTLDRGHPADRDRRASTSRRRTSTSRRPRASCSPPSVASRSCARRSRARSTAYDYVLIDCPPNLGLLTVNGLVAATGVIIPVQTQYYAMKGLNNLVKVINAIRLKLNRDLRILGLLPTFYDGRTNLARDMLDELRVVGDHHVFDSIVRNTVKLGEAPLVGRPITSYASSSRGGADLSRTRAGGDRTWPDLTSAPPPRGACPRSASSPRRSSACSRPTARRGRVGVRIVPVDRIEPNPEQPRLAFDAGRARRAGGVDPRARRPPADPRPPARPEPLPADRRRATLARVAARRPRDDPGPHRGDRRRHGARDRDHREPAARGPLAARRSGDVRPDDPRARLQHPQAGREAGQGQGLPREPAAPGRRARRRSASSCLCAKTRCRTPTS